MVRTRYGWRLAACVAGAGLFLSACNAAVETPPQPSPEAAAASKPAELTAVPAVSVNALMVTWVDHSGHVLWNAEQPGRKPMNDAEWLEISEHATQLAAAGTLIQLGGTGQADAGWARLPGWKTSSQNLTNAALDGIKAAKAKDLPALVQANGRLVESCESCHKEFKPDLPSEGIAHHPPVR